MGAVPFQEAKWARLGKRVMSPTSTSSRAAPEGADSVQVHERGAGRGDEFLELFVRGLLALVDPLEVGDQFRGHPAARLAGGVAGTDCGQERLGLGCGEILLGPAWGQLQQQLVELGDHAGVVLAQGPTSVDHDSQHGQLLVIDDGTQPRHPSAN